MKKSKQKTKSTIITIQENNGRPYGSLKNTNKNKEYRIDISENLFERVKSLVK